MRVLRRDTGRHDGVDDGARGSIGHGTAICGCRCHHQSVGMRCGRTRGKERTIGIGAAGDVVGVAVEDVVQPNNVGGEGRDDVQQPVLDIRVIWRICGHLELAVAAKSKRQLQSGKDDKA